MRSNFVEPTSEVFDQDLRIDPILQALVAELAVERFVRTALPRLARINVRGVDVRGATSGSRETNSGPLSGQIRRCAVNADELREHLDHARGADPARDVDGQALARVLFDHGQALHLLTVRAGVEHEVRPHLTSAGRCGGRG